MSAVPAVADLILYIRICRAGAEADAAPMAADMAGREGDYVDPLTLPRLAAPPPPAAADERPPSAAPAPVVPSIVPPPPAAAAGATARPTARASATAAVPSAVGIKIDAVSMESKGDVGDVTCAVYLLKLVSRVACWCAKPATRGVTHTHTHNNARRPRRRRQMSLPRRRLPAAAAAMAPRVPTARLPQLGRAAAVAVCCSFIPRSIAARRQQRPRVSVPRS